MLTVTKEAQQKATRAVFFVPGFLVACWAPLVPFAKQRASLSDADLGLILLCLGMGSLIAMPLAGKFASKYGLRNVMLVAITALVFLLPMLSIANSAMTLAAVIFAFGAAMGSMDVAINMQAVVVEKESGKPMMAGFHAFYSIGSLIGVTAMTALISLGVDIRITTVLAACVAVGIALTMNHAWRRERVPAEERKFVMPHGVLLLIAALMFMTFFIEGSMLDWSAVFLHEVRGVDLAHAGWGFVAFNLAMTFMRLVGDRIVAALGSARTIFIGGVVACLGMVTIVVAPTFAWTLFGFVLLGVGEANIVPILFTYAGRQTLVPERIALPLVSTVGYAGVLLGPALIGLISDQLSLRVAFLFSALVLAFVAVAGSRIRILR